MSDDDIDSDYEIYMTGKAYHNAFKRKRKNCYSGKENLQCDVEGDVTKIARMAKRAHHNELERKRRETLSDCYFNLEKSLPQFDSNKEKKRGSRLQIIKDAESYIKSMQKKIEAVKKDIDKMKLSNGLLEEKCRNLQYKAVLHEPIVQESNEF